MMLSRLARASCVLPLFRIRTIATILLRFKTQGSALSLIQWHHNGRRAVSFASLDLEDSKINKPRHVSATQLSNEDYVNLADTYFEAVEEYAGYVQEEKMELTIEHRNDVITITALGIGNYVLKRHDSIRQIWLSSPISRSTGFEWFEHGENSEKQNGYDENSEQQDGYDDVVMGRWRQLNDGTNLSEVLNRELGMEMEMNWFY